MSGSCGQRKGVLTLFVFDGDVCTPLDERHRSDHIRLDHGEHEWSAAIVTLLVDIGTLVEHEVNAVHITLSGGSLQGGTSFLHGLVDVGTILDQKLADLRVTHLCGDVQSSGALASHHALVHIVLDLRKLQKALDDSFAAILRGDVKRREAVHRWPRRIRTSIDQKIQCVDETTLCGDEWVGDVHFAVNVTPLRDQFLHDVCVVALSGDIHGCGLIRGHSVNGIAHV
mmetsp:Transcript_14824/g.30059  ORF Transcript_14824/g.30059 Transcript_14824/m.30059 type:complete len:227 (+) Transcript_14824:544-1224(+)